MARSLPRGAVAIACLVGIAGGLVGCSAAQAEAPAASGPTSPEPVVVHAPVDATKRPAPLPDAPDLDGLTPLDPLHVVPGLPGLDGRTQLRSDDQSLGRWRTAVLTADTAAYDSPDGRVVGVLPLTTLGIPTTVPVVQATPSGWLRVMPAVRGALPSDDRAQVNGRTVWIRATDTRTAGTDWRIVVDRKKQTITVDEGDRTRTFPVLATGSRATPTPVGAQFVVGTFWDEPGTTTPRVVLLSTQSEALDDYDKRTGTSVTAIHTTTLRGRGEVSTGCVRVSDEVMDELWHRVPAGTVVVVR
ncbi:L,D-transpeptidase [Cellulomonas sp. HZM]|uniref:L,D-transpeptidase n=1 Tax=Cellulomonas sp. HZM TaxID=1454010 RepID=UPI00049318D0|nr:L,D-transpeptidase [Cellulomonas sp. HZM]